MSRKFFGTDGIRGRTNEGVMTAATEAILPHEIKAGHGLSVTSPVSPPRRGVEPFGSPLIARRAHGLPRNGSDIFAFEQ